MPYRPNVSCSKNLSFRVAHEHPSTGDFPLQNSLLIRELFNSRGVHIHQLCAPATRPAASTCVRVLRCTSLSCKESATWCLLPGRGVLVGCISVKFVTHL